LTVVDIQCDGTGDASLQRWTADHNETDEEAERLGAGAASCSS